MITDKMESTPTGPGFTPNHNLPPLGEGPRRRMQLEIEVTEDFEKRLDNQWMVEREIHADRWNWKWADDESGAKAWTAANEKLSTLAAKCSVLEDSLHGAVEQIKDLESKQSEGDGGPLILKSYYDRRVGGLLKQLEQAEKDCRKSEQEAELMDAKCASLVEKIDEAFAASFTNDDVQDGNYYVPTVIMLDLKQLSRSTDCGTGWASPEKAGRLRDWLRAEMDADEIAKINARDHGEWDRYHHLEGHRSGLLHVLHHLRAQAEQALAETEDVK